MDLARNGMSTPSMSTKDQRWLNADRHVRNRTPDGQHICTA
jgi:hypothetical protein